MPWAHATRPPSAGRNDEPARLTMTCAAPNLRTDYSAFFPGSSDFSTFGQRYAPLHWLGQLCWLHYCCYWPLNDWPLI